MKLIDKDALVAWLKGSIKDYWMMGHSKNAMEIYPFALEEVIKYIDTLEVKEVKEGPVSNDLEEAISQSFIYHENHGDDFRSDKQIETAYRYGFEDGFKYKESIIKDIEKQNLEMNEEDLDKKIKDYFSNQPIITRSKGVDYQLIPSGEDIAKHFFELGLKAQKGEKL